LLLCLAGFAHADDPHISAPSVVLNNVPFDISVSGLAAGTGVTLHVDEQRLQAAAADDGAASFTDVVVHSAGSTELAVFVSGNNATQQDLRVLPGWVSVLPPLLAILMALLLRNVIPALLVGIWLGAAALQSFTPRGIFVGLLDSFQVFVVGALANADHAAIILFSMMIGGMVGIITRNGGMARIVELFVSKAKSAVSGQVSVWMMGLMIFFDDYSNTLVVGNTARPLTDRLRISREKLAYIVDSTAAPVVCIALITTWIGYEVGLIGTALEQIPELTAPAYTVFLQSIPYSFYPILAIVFVFAVALTGRDFGPMYRAEVRARNGQVSPIASEDLPAMQGDNLEPKENVPFRAWNAFVPLLVMIAGLLGGLYFTGSGDSLTEIIGSADSYKAMLWASLLGALTAAVMTIAQGILNAQETVDAWYGGVRAMLFAMIVLVLAWALSSVTEALHTADYLVSILAGSLPAPLVPATVFILSAITAFTTGTSWGTMGILMPLVVPLTWAVMGVAGMQSPEHMHLLYSAIACNLAGAVWGDHCSPISDTTVLSSMASGCDHIEHIRTQMPYALLVGTVALAAGTIPGGYGVSPLLSIPVAVVILLSCLRYFGRVATPDRA
jgi:Na+/H+ antiporter NhaC